VRTINRWNYLVTSRSNCSSTELSITIWSYRKWRHRLHTFITSPLDKCQCRPQVLAGLLWRQLNPVHIENNSEWYQEPNWVLRKKRKKILNMLESKRDSLVVQQLCLHTEWNILAFQISFFFFSDEEFLWFSCCDKSLPQRRKSNSNRQQRMKCA